MDLFYHKLTVMLTLVYLIVVSLITYQWVLVLVYSCAHLAIMFYPYLSSAIRVKSLILLEAP